MSLFKYKDLEQEQQKEVFAISSVIVSEESTHQSIDEIAKLFAENDLVSFLTQGKWSIYKLIEKVVIEYGPGELSFCTWGLSEPPLRVLHNLKERGLITRLFGILDHRISERQPKAFQFFTGIADGYGYAKSHAKGYFFKTDTQQISIIVTANLNRNTKNEFGTLIRGPKSYNLYEKWIHKNLQMNKEKK